MSNNNIVNRALKLENIFLKFEDKEKTKFIIKLKLTEDSIFLKDLGIKKEANILNDSKIMPPEILEKKEYNEKIDLWCLGVIIYVLFFREFPYKSNNKNEKLQKMKSGNISIKTDDS
jgi:serine/threonine protein kinase